ncbi:MAG: hypothetical protein CMO55_10400 [Verrucomicrobiales bacterium]|nr:hypothetical protein [Verrucomicrobiales bacterium]
MKLKRLGGILAAAIAVPGILHSEDVAFPAGDFNTNPASSWTTDTTGAGSVTFPDGGGGDLLARIGVAVTGSGELVATVPSGFQANSLYSVSVDVASASLVSLASNSFGLQILDGGDNVVAELNQDQLVGLLGLDLSFANTLTTDLNLLDGILSDDLLLLGTLRDLLAELDLAGDSDLSLAIEELLVSLVGEDETVVTAVSDLLESVLDGDLDPGSLTDLDIADLLNLDPSNPIVADVSELLDSVLGNEEAVDALLNVVTVLLGDDGDLSDLSLIADLFETLQGDEDLFGVVGNILNLELIESDLIGSITEGEVLELLGFLDSSSSSFQTVTLLFTTGETAPTGNMQVRLSAGASVSVTFETDFDNVAIERFDLVATPPVDTPPNVNISNTRPLVRAKRQRVIRVTNKPRVRIQGTARAFGEDNFIRKVQVAVRGRGTRPGQRKFRNKVKGTTNWTARVRVPVGDRTRVLFKAVDATGKRSVTSLVRVRRR